MDGVAHLKIYAEVSSSYFNAEGEHHLVSLPPEDEDDPRYCLSMRVICASLEEFGGGAAGFKGTTHKLFQK